MGLSILALWWTAAALAGRVDVEDGSGCLEAQALRDALVPVLGSALQRIDIDVFVEAKGDSRALHVTVDVGAHRWLETLEIDARECLYAPTAVALGIQRGLAGLPGFNWKKLERDPTLYRLGGSLGVSGPIAPRVLVAGRASVGRRVRGVGNIRLEGSPLWRTNASRVVGLTAGLGGGPSWRAGSFDVRVEVGGQFGALWILSRDPQLPASQARPHVSGIGGVELGGSGPAAVGLYLEVARPLYLVTVVHGDIVGVEPPFRGVLALRHQGKIIRE